MTALGHLASKSAEHFGFALPKCFKTGPRAEPVRDLFQPRKMGALVAWPDTIRARDFAAMFDRAVLRSQGNERNVPEIELSAEPDDGR